MKNGLIGLVMAGGESRRMGRDKGGLVYYKLPQREHVYEMLSGFCEKTLISVHSQRTEIEKPEFELISDLPEYDQTGPIAGILTAFHKYPDHDLLVVGCDYPYLTSADLHDFLASINEESIAAAFCSEEDQLEPLLAWYSREAKSVLQENFRNGKYSLRDFLRSCNAAGFCPKNKLATLSVDTPEAYEKVKKEVIATH